MIRTVCAATIAISLAGCVTTSHFNEQVAKTEEQEKRADSAEHHLADTQKQLADTQKQLADTQKQLADLKADSEKKQSDLEAKLKADDGQIAALQKSNHDLSASLEAGKNDLRKKISALVTEKDALTQKLADLTASTNAQIADLNRKLADIQAQKDAEIAKMKQSYDSVTASLKSEIDKGAVQIKELRGRLTLNLVDKVLFRTGEAEVNEEGRKVLDEIGGVLNKLLDKDIRIDGHTDDRPISGELTHKFATNWELSTARATSVARYLIDKDGVDPKRLVASGYGEYRPVAPNDSPENRALNRRIEIVLVPKD